MDKTIFGVSLGAIVILVFLFGIRLGAGAEARIFRKCSNLGATFEQCLTQEEKVEEL